VKSLGVGYTFRSVYSGKNKTQKSLKLMVLNFQWIKKHEGDLKMDATCFHHLQTLLLYQVSLHDSKNWNNFAMKN